MHCCDDKNPHVLLTKSEHDRYMSQNEDFALETDDGMILETDDAPSWETKEFKKGYQNAIMQFQKKYNLRSKDVPAKLKQTDSVKKPTIDTPSTSRPRPDNAAQGAAEKAKSKEEVPKTAPKIGRETSEKEVEKTCSPFNFEHEMAKIKIYIPFNELIRKGEYREQIIKMLKAGGTPNTLNIQDDHPAILFGPRVEETSDDEDIPPFYVSLKIHDLNLHNAVLDSGASHNLMLKVVMDELGLEVTRPYKDLFSFDSRKVKCLGLIKDLVVSLAQIPAKNMVMDIVVADIPPKFGMLLSRSWVAKLKGTLQMDMTYATILVFGHDRRLYREVLLKYMVSSKTQPHNHPIYVVDTKVGSSIFYNDFSFGEEGSTTITITDEKTAQEHEFRRRSQPRRSRGWYMGEPP
jgi:hypothetical protein